MQAAVGRRECEFRRGVGRRRGLRHHPVVVVEGLLHGDLDGEVARHVVGLRLRVVRFGFVCACVSGVLVPCRRGIRVLWTVSS